MLTGDLIQRRMAVYMKVSAVALQFDGSVLVGTLMLSHSWMLAINWVVPFLVQVEEWHCK